MLALALGAYDGWQTILVLAAVCVVLGCWVATLLDIFRHAFRQRHQKVLWILVVTLFPVVGPFIYIILGRKQKIE
jgi:hypothetical protein